MDFRPIDPARFVAGRNAVICAGALGLFELAAQKSVKLDWVNCGLCVDERGVEKQVEGARRGSPADAWKLAEASEGFLFVATK